MGPADDALISELREKHRLDLENLTLARHPFKTLKLFTYDSALCKRHSLLYTLTKGVWCTILTILVVAIGLLPIATDGPHEKPRMLVSSIEFNFSGHYAIAIMLDTKGPEVRTGDVPQPILLKEGHEFNFTIKRGVSTENTVSVNYDDCYILYCSNPTKC